LYEDKTCQKSYYLGTPTHAFDRQRKTVWERELDCYKTVRKETGLAYNRFRYYDRASGSYISQDPIGLAGGKELYGYVKDTNIGEDRDF
jgi:uncharacterized protein RhaS with RHS repeats